MIKKYFARIGIFITTGLWLGLWTTNAQTNNWSNIGGPAILILQIAGIILFISGLVFWFKNSSKFSKFEIVLNWLLVILGIVNLVGLGFLIILRIGLSAIT